MNASSISERLQNWLDSQPRSIPLRALADSSGSGLDYRTQIQDEIAGSRLTADSLVVAMLWLRVGIIEPAHEIVRNGSTPMASYLHGVIHRLEADYWNSKYWFRQVKDDRLLQSLSNAIVEKVAADGLSEIAASLKVILGTTYSPVEFVSAHERMSKLADQVSSHAAAMERIAWIEWESLWRLL